VVDPRLRLRLALKPTYMLNIILIVLPILVIGFLILVATRPDSYQVTRSITMAASPEVVFPKVNELRQWEPWNPWGKLDPKMQLTYAGPPSGVGASYAWVGNGQVGSGRMTTTTCQPNQRICFKMEFFKPMAGVSEAEFTFEPVGGGTKVTWSIVGRSSFPAKAVGLIMSMDKMIGGQFEKGLAALKKLSEGAA
jgi:uncharacterized protein YndB with AHSA1/START domain